MPQRSCKTEKTQRRSSSRKPSCETCPRLYGKQNPTWRLEPCCCTRLGQGKSWPCSQNLAPQKKTLESLKKEMAERKPRKMWPNETCPGRSPAEPCRFTQRANALGQPCRLTKGEAACKFCDQEKLDACFAVPQTTEICNPSMPCVACRRTRRCHAGSYGTHGLKSSRPCWRQRWHGPLGRRQQLKRALLPRLKQKLGGSCWEPRRHSGVQPTEDEQRQYRQKKADDQRRLRSKFGPLVEAQGNGRQQLEEPFGNKHGGMVPRVFVENMQVVSSHGDSPFA